MTFLSEVGRLCRLPSKMKLFLAAISIIAAIHYGHALDAESSACDVSIAFDDAMQMARDMECDFDDGVSIACLCFQTV